MADKQENKRSVNKVKKNPFPYNKVKATYMKLMKEYLDKSPADELLTSESVRKIIEELQWIKSLSTTKVLISSNCSKKYELVHILTQDGRWATNPNGYDILTASGDPFRQVLSYEDSFDVYVEAYLDSQNPTLEDMLKKVETNYVVSKLSVELFLKSCADQPKVESDSSKFNDTAELHILGTSHLSDTNFKYILLYADVKTNFILLRPVVEFNEYEISSELYQIFADFGPPKLIRSTCGDTILRKILMILHSTPMKYEFAIENKSLHLQEIVTYISTELERWINTVKDGNWVVGCYIVQLSINSVGDVSAYDKLFGNKINYVDSLSTHSNVSQSIIGTGFNNSNDAQARNDSENMNSDVNIFESSKKTPTTSQKVINLDINVCQQCNKSIKFKSYKCCFCEKLFHLVCVNRTLVEEKDVLKSRIICFNCHVQYISVDDDIQVID